MTVIIEDQIMMVLEEWVNKNHPFQSMFLVKTKKKRLIIPSFH